MKIPNPKDSVWDDMAEEPAEAALFKIKAALFQSLQTYAEEHDADPKAHVKMGIGVSRLKDIHRGHFNRYTLDELILITERVGINPIRICTEEQTT